MSLVLVVDDDPRFRALVVELLVRRGDRVIEAADGAAATAAMRAAPDLAIVDGLLPDCRGLDWIETVGRATPATAILFASASRREAAAARARLAALGVAAVLQKPISARVLLDAVADILRGARASRAPAPRSCDAPTEATDPALAHQEPDAVAANFEAAFALLRADYRSELPAKLAELTAAGDRCATSADDPRACTALIALAHRLRGTAGSYGFEAVGDAAGAIEDAMLELAANARAQAWPTLRARLERVSVG